MSEGYPRLLEDREVLVARAETLADAPLDQIGAVAEQEAWHAEWWAAARSRRDATLPPPPGDHG
ncbi:hypothetical protein [Amycolatopsis pittospori]|uniref:hypothetical protein n=1 Tax=Amycolatopsis pittospori TaxID=2749434 RepID=UPI0015EFE0C5|nr:hypothetical protein [Amycolatopsis pittospori]